VYSNYIKVTSQLSNVDEKLNYLYKELKSLKRELQELHPAEQSLDHKQNTHIKKQDVMLSAKSLDEAHELDNQSVGLSNLSVRMTESPQQEFRPQEKRSLLESVKAKDQKRRSSFSFEKEIGERLPVWIGAIALILAGVFLIKYSIDQGLLTPAIRVAVGIISGLILIAVGIYFRVYRQIANYIPISQAITGAGIAILYISIYAANQYFSLIPKDLAFLGLFMVTAIAVCLSLLHGLPIAILGMFSGYLTPALLKSNDPQASGLFLYLTLINLGLTLIIHKKKWWILNNFLITFSLIWVLFWLNSAPKNHGDFYWIVQLLVGMNIGILFYGQSDSKIKVLNWLKVSDDKIISGLISLVLSLVLTSGLIAYYQFQMADWYFFALMTCGVIVLAVFKENEFGTIPYLTLILTNLMLAFWQAPDLGIRFQMTFMFAMIYVVSGSFVQWSARDPRIWAGLVAATLLSLYFLTYFHTYILIGSNSQNHFWSLIALTVSTFLFFKIYFLYLSERPFVKLYRNQLLGIYIFTFTTFLTTGLMIEIPRDFLPVVIAVEMFVASLIYRKLSLGTMVWIARLLGGLFLILISPQIVMLIELTTYSILEQRLNLLVSIPIAQWPLFQLGVPSACFFLTAKQIEKSKNANTIIILELIAIGMTVLMVYYLNRHLFHSDMDILFAKASFTERGVTTNAIFVFGLLCFYLANSKSKRSFLIAGQALTLVALFRILFFEFLKYNPVLVSQKVGSTFVLNSLIINFGLPVIWILILLRFISKKQSDLYGNYFYGLIHILVFTVISLNIKQYFHGSDLTAGAVSRLEIYTYSVAWLIHGILLIIAGTYFKNQPLRIASLFVIIISIAKVFIYDASELDGILRVLTFLGLGVSLIGLSWFYSRYVFQIDGLADTESKS
jgi:uncharacterized membrane protein